MAGSARRVKLRLEGVSKRFRRADGSAFWAVRGFDLEVGAGEIVTFVGPSGCGKSTVLNCIGGLLQADEGTIEVDGSPVRTPGPDRAIVFQQASLLPWATALGNVEYGMRMQRRFDRAERSTRARDALELVGLADFAGFYPGQLSGGMQQRINLARAIATEPQILLMDEPFGALDAMTKERMQEELLRIIQRTGQAVVFITHDITEAVYLGDRVVVMGTDPGRIVDLVDVPFPRPRALGIQEDPAFQRLRRAVRTTLDGAATAPADNAGDSQADFAR